MLDKVMVQQTTRVEFVLKNKQCTECLHDFTDHNWGSLIQIRQKGGSKNTKTLRDLEDALIKKPAFYAKLKKIEVQKDGLDLYCKQKPFSDKIVAYINSKFPTKTKLSKRLVSTQSSTSHDRYEFTTHIEIAPLCKGVY